MFWVVDLLPQTDDSCPSSIDATDQSLPSSEQTSVVSIETLFADTDGWIKVDQCLEHQVITAIPVTESRVIIDPKMILQRFIQRFKTCLFPTG